ncbi:MAG: lipoate--protein ligase family protein [Paludibacteraceae bacterium]|nr:lipoate--protein ligase family protein [Paludibacteraceae bacterium]
MVLLNMPEGKRLDWYLAQEERLAKDVTEDTLFFWSVSPTVIYGRHQVLENEVNMTYCQENGIQVIQRKSGGGCVYADEGNLMISYITPSLHAEQAFQFFLSMLSFALRQLGYPAVTTAHNDVLIAGRKVSGSACYALPTGTIVHATMMWDVNVEALERAITPSVEKLQKHAVQSVRQRVTNLKSLSNTNIVNISELQQRLAKEMLKYTEKLNPIV